MYTYEFTYLPLKKKKKKKKKKKNIIMYVSLIPFSIKLIMIK